MVEAGLQNLVELFIVQTGFGRVPTLRLTFVRPMSVGGKMSFKSFNQSLLVARHENLALPPDLAQAVGNLVL